MANRVKGDWRETLQMMNESLKADDMKIVVTDDDNGYWFIDILSLDGQKFICNFVSNDFEDELYDDILSAHHRAKEIAEEEKKALWIVTNVTISESEYEANGHSSAKVFDSIDAAKAQLAEWKQNEINFCKEEGRDYNIYEDKEDKFRMGWCMDSEQIRIEIHKVFMNK